ncbi:MAG: hypothetical protein WBG71_01850 [Leeuwenhoekiella sp.]
MIKNLFAFIILLLSTISVFAQNKWRLELGVGTNVGSYPDKGLLLTSDLSYLIPVNEKISLGPAVGYSGLIFNNSDRIDLFPIAVASRIDLTENFLTGIDLGYGAIWLDEWFGGFYYRPKVGYNFKKFTLLASYSAIKDEG